MNNKPRNHETPSIPSDPSAYLFPLDPDIASRLTAPRTKAQAELQERFLVALAQCGTDREACEIAGVAARTLRDWKHDDSLGFLARYDLARASWGQFLERLAYERVREPSFNGRIGSDVLLLGLLNANLPDKYKRIDKTDESAAFRVLEFIRRGSDGSRAPMPFPASVSEEASAGEASSVSQVIERRLEIEVSRQVSSEGEQG